MHNKITKLKKEPIRFPLDRLFHLDTHLVIVELIQQVHKLYLFLYVYVVCSRIMISIQFYYIVFLVRQMTNGV